MNHSENPPSLQEQASFKAAGNLLKSLRTDAGVSQQAAAANAGMGHSALSKAETGKGNLSGHAAFTITRALGASPDAIITTVLLSNGICQNDASTVIEALALQAVEQSKQHPEQFKQEEFVFPAPSSSAIQLAFILYPPTHNSETGEGLTKEESITIHLTERIRRGQLAGHIGTKSELATEYGSYVEQIGKATDALKKLGLISLPSAPKFGFHTTNKEFLTPREVAAQSIRAYLEKEIAGGRMQERLPSSIDLQKKFGCPEAVVGIALRALRKSGTVVDRGRKGTWVAPETLRQLKLKIADEAKVFPRTAIRRPESLEELASLLNKKGPGGATPQSVLLALQKMDTHSKLPQSLAHLLPKETKQEA